MNGDFVEYFNNVFILNSLFISALVYIIRVVCEFMNDKLKTNHVFQELLLPILPLLIGAFIGALPLGLGFIRTVVAGMFSGQVYKFVKALLKVGTADADPGSENRTNR